MKKDIQELNPHELKGYDFNWEKAFKYAKLMEQGITFPPIRVHRNSDGTYQIRNGMHRTIAAKLCGLTIIGEIISDDQVDDFFLNLEDNFKIR